MGRSSISEAQPKTMVVTAMGRRPRKGKRDKGSPPSPENAARLLGEAGTIAVAQGNLRDAETAYLQAVALGSNDAGVYNNLAAIYDKWGVKQDEKLELLSRAYELAPDRKDIRKNLNSLLRKRVAALVKEERYEDALPHLLKRVETDPDSADVHRELGSCYWKTGKPEDAIREYTRAINLNPNHAGYYNELGLVCFEVRLLAEAQGAFQEVLRLNPKAVMAYSHLGILANLIGLTGLAITFLRRALAIDPKCTPALNNLALCLRDQGEQVESRQRSQEAMALSPDSESVLSGYLLSLNDDPTADPAWVAAEHRRFEGLMKQGQRTLKIEDPNPSKKLRVGYLSPDFRTHSVAYFIAPTLEQHDRDEVAVTCYSTGFEQDGITARIGAAAGTFRNVYRMSNHDLAKVIQADRIDVLVELSGHTAGNRLAMLANRVAPVQVTYLGYPNTTGLAGMDYRITDSIADPLGLTEAWHTEKLIRLDGGFLAYEPPGFAKELPVFVEPFRKVGHVTYGSFNNLAKINDVVLDTWAAILEQVPKSCILLKARGLRNDRVKERILAAFAARGINGEERIQLMAREHSAVDHLQLYNRMDLALDTFPYNGTTTTCEALWMGTPVVTYEGRSHAGRVGASVLTHVGLGELVAKDLQGYINKAVSLGRDWEALVRLRSGLRERFAASPVMDAHRLARGLETAYRDAWRRFCASSR
jgi:protein O-GlcNAc transferase